MIRFKDSVWLNLRRTRRKKLSGRKKSFAVLFTFIFCLICLLNAGYGIVEKLTEILHYLDYHNPNIVFARSDFSQKRYIQPEDIARIADIKGVLAVQEKLHISRGHLFLLNRVNYIQPDALIGYDDALFRSYVSLPAERIDPQAIPILLSHNLFNLSYDRDQHVFLRQKQQETAAYLGRKFTLMIDPFCGQEGGLAWDLFQHDGRYDPILINRRIADQQKQTLKYLEQNRHDKLKYCKTLSVRCQIVGYIHDGRIDNPLSGYGVIPSSLAQQIRNLTQLRQEALNSESDIESRLYRKAARGRSLLYILCEAQHKNSIIQAIEEMGLKVEPQTAASNRALAELLKELRNDNTALIFLLIVLLPFIGFILISIYKLLSAEVKDSIIEIGVMRCVGATRKDVRQLFRQLCFFEVFQVLAASLIASNLMLSAIGWYTANKLNRISVDQMQSELFIIISTVGDFTAFWLMAPLWFQLLPIIPLVPITLMASYFPVRKAASVDPVVAMRD